MLVALDIAKNMGVVLANNANISLYQVNGTPLQQYQVLKNLKIGKDSQVLIEDFTYFNTPNPLTTSKLLQRFGYLYYRLLEENASVTYYNVNTVRKFLGCVTNKKGMAKKYIQESMRNVLNFKISTDEADALALILYHKGVPINSLSAVNIIHREKIIC